MLWIDHECYVGPCRRASRQRIRLFDRRARGAVEGAPSTEKLIRQLRVSNLSLASDAEQRRFRLRLQAAVALTTDRGQHKCGVELALLLKLYDAAPTPREIADAAAASLDRAITALRD